jgi:hypothetical protein
MTVSLSINPDLAIAREIIYQDYIHECQMLLIEVPKLTEKFNISYTEGSTLIPYIEISATYDKCFKENLTLIKNCVLKKV